MGAAAVAAIRTLAMGWFSARPRWAVGITAGLCLTALAAGGARLDGERGAAGEAAALVLDEAAAASTAGRRPSRRLRGNRGDCDPPCPLAPTGDVELSPGNHLFTSIDIPAGVTVRAPGRLLLYSVAGASIAGTLAADCGALEVHAQGEVTITGTLDNRCTGEEIEAGDLVIHTAGGSGISIGTPAAPALLHSSGGLDVSNNPALGEWEFDVLPFQRTSAPVAPVCAAFASPLDGPVIGELPLKVRFQGEGADPNGGPVTYAWDFGDGGTSNEQAPEHEFASGASYDVTLTVTDGGGQLCVASAHVTNEADGPAVALRPTFLVVEAGEPLAFLGYARSAASDAWDLGDGTQASTEYVEHAYAAPGRYEVRLEVADENGGLAAAQASVWVYPTPPQPLPLARRLGLFGGVYFNASYRPEPSRTGPGRPTDIQAEGDLTIGSGAVIEAQDGRDAPAEIGVDSVEGENGGAGGTLSFSATGATTLDAGASVASGEGGNGGTARAISQPGRNATAVGGEGGPGGSLLVRPHGGLHVGSGDGSTAAAIRVGSGGRGGDAIAEVADDTSEGCVQPDASRAAAKALGGRGGAGGETFVYQASKAPVDVEVRGGNGGRGGDADAKGGAGSTSRCPAYAVGGRGARAEARAGWGGDGFFYSAVWIFFPVGTAAFDGGDGGAASARGGAGGAAYPAPPPECGPTGAEGGGGGDALAQGGWGGLANESRPEVRRGANGHANATGGRGGDAAAAAIACRPCQHGGSAEARGGAGGDARAKRATLYAQADTDATGGEGGNASATGGAGGDCSTCPSGTAGRGGAASAFGGSLGIGSADTGTNGFEITLGRGGSAWATGGPGGVGASCCDPVPWVGGAGGAGGNAEATAGSKEPGSVTEAVGGAGGDGGDGTPPGAGGAGGLGIVAGLPGFDGASCPPSTLEVGALRVPLESSFYTGLGGFRRRSQESRFVSGGGVTIMSTSTPAPARQTTLLGIEPQDILILDDGTTIVAGRALTNSRGWLARLQADGSLAWQKTVDQADAFRRLARVDGTTFLAAGRDAAGSQVQVARVTTAGAVQSINKLSGPAASAAQALLPLADGGFVAAYSVGAAPPSDAVVVRVGSGGAITWQLRFGRVSINSLLEASGDIFLVGGYRPPAASADDGWIARVTGNGSVIWQRSYGQAGSVGFRELTSGAGGLVAFGQANPGGALRLVQLAADGSVLGVRGYGVNGTPLGAGSTDEGGVAMGTHSTTLGYTSIVTASDLTMPGCSGPGLGSVIDAATVPSAVAAAVVTNPGITISVVAGTSAATPVAPASKTTAPTNLCDSP